MTTDIEREARNAIACANCNAPAGKACTQPTDTGRRPVTWVHTTRLDAYRAMVLDDQGAQGTGLPMARAIAHDVEVLSREGLRFIASMLDTMVDVDATHHGAVLQDYEAHALHVLDMSDRIDTTECPACAHWLARIGRAFDPPSTG